MINSVTLYEITEHSESEEEICVDNNSRLATVLTENQYVINDPKYFMQEPHCLGITLNNERLKAHYYIGVDWLEKEKTAIAVSPKIPRIDMTNLFWQHYKWVLKKNQTIFPSVTVFALMNRRYLLPTIQK